MRIVVHEPTLSGDAAGRTGAAVLAAVRAELRRLGSTAPADEGHAGGGPVDVGRADALAPTPPDASPVTPP